MPIVELERYTSYLKENLPNVTLLDFRSFESLYDYYRHLLDNWEKILELEVEPVFQLTISYVLMIYTEKSKLEQLYNKYESIDVGASYLRLVSRSGENEKAQKMIVKFEEVKNSIETISLSKIEFLLWLAYYYIIERRYDEFSEPLNSYVRECESYLEKTKDHIAKFQLKSFELYIRGLYHHVKRDIIEAKEFYSEAISTLESNNIFDSFLLATLYNMYGNILHSAGDQKALDKYQQALLYYSSNKIDRGIAASNGNIASLLMQEGEFEHAITLHLETVKIMQLYQDQRNVLVCYTQIFSCYKSLGKFKQAEAYLLKALNLMETYNLKYDQIYQDAIEFFAYKGDFEKSEENLKLFYKVLEIEEGTNTNGEALGLINKGFIELKKKNIFDAETYLKQGLNIAKILNNTPLGLQSLIYLIELFSVKYKLEFDEERRRNILETIEEYIKETVIFFKQFHTFFQMVNYRILLANVHILMNKLNTALKVLEKTRELVNEYDLEPQKKTVEEMINKVIELKNIASAPKKKEHQQTLIEDSEEILKSYSIKGIKDDSVLLGVNDAPELLNLLVIHKNGLPLFTYNFQKATDDNKDLLVAGFINALQSYSSEISVKQGKFNLIQHTDYIILIENRDEFSIALFSDKFTYFLKDNTIKFANYVETVLKPIPPHHLNRSDTLETVSNDFTKYLETYFETT